MTGDTARRRRGAALEEAILDAAAAELVESGYPALTMDAVAKRAGTNKNAIYRRWSNRAALGVAAYRRLARERMALPDTGELRADVLGVLRLANSDLGSARAEVLRGLLASVGDEPELLTELHEHVADAGSALWLDIVGRAVQRGEVGSACLRPRVVTVAIVLLRNEYVTRGLAPVADEVLMEIVDEVYLPLLRGCG